MDALKLFHHTPENLIVVSAQYKIVDATNAYLQVTRRIREEIIGLHFLLEAFPDPNYTFEENPVRLSFEKVLQTKQVDYMELVSYRIAMPEAEGGGFYDSYWEASHTPVLDHAGNIDYIIQKTTDVTERELARQARAVSEKKFKILTDTIPQIIFTADSTGKINHINKRMSSYTGISEAELYRSDYNWSNLIHPDDVAQLKRGAQEASSKPRLRVSSRTSDP